MPRSSDGPLAIATSKTDKPRWLRFKLATLLLVITVFGVWLGIAVNKARRQAQGVEAIRKLNGVIHFNYQYDRSGKYDGKAEPIAPAWLRDAIGDEYFCDVVVIYLAYGSGFIRTGRSKVQDADLPHFEGLGELRTLELGRNLAITDQGLECLCRMKKLETLYLYRTGVRGSGLMHLTQLPRLRSLSLDRTPMTDEGLAHIGMLRQLTWLQLDNTRISDDGLAHLASLNKLEELSVANTTITDVGLKYLRGLASLKQLNLGGTNVTSNGVRNLQSLLPECAITTTYGLGVDPTTLPLWAENYHPTKEELINQVKTLGGWAEVDNGRPERPIIAVTFMDNALSDAAIARLIDEMPDLKSLNLRRVLVGDALLAYLQHRTYLLFLSLQYSRVSDAGAKHLADMDTLTELDLTGTRVTDNAVKDLERLTRLERLSLGETRCTEEGLIRLQSALPNCQISF